MESIGDELSSIIADVKKSLNLKLNELNRVDLTGLNDKTQINGLRIKIKALEDYIEEITRLNSSNPSLIINFRKRANDIIKEIELL